MSPEQKNEAALLSVSGLTVFYGSRQAVSGFDLQVRPGEIVALLGPNGAGKSTTMGAISGTLSPSEGTISIEGFAQGPKLRARCGFAAQPPSLYEFFTVEEHLQFVCDARGGERAEISPLLESLRIDGIAHRLCRELSFGMRQRVGLAAALVGPVSVALFDETLNGLDPHAMRLSKQVLQHFANSGGAILLSTHMLDVATTLCTRVVVMDQGQKKADTMVTPQSREDIESLYFRHVEDIGPS